MFRPPRFTGRSNPLSSASDTGSKGERFAARYLRRQKGFQILLRNWRDGRDEIDLVARDGTILVFIEVKTRSTTGLVPGYYAAADKRKKNALRRAIRTYLRRLAEKPSAFRFDIVEVNLAAPPEKQILHFENIPLFSKSFRAR